MIVVLGSNFGNVNVYDFSNLLIIVVGGGYNYGWYIVYDWVNNILFCNFFIGFFNGIGIEIDFFGSGIGLLMFDWFLYFWFVCCVELFVV